VNVEGHGALGPRGGVKALNYLYAEVDALNKPFQEPLKRKVPCLQNSAQA